MRVGINTGEVLVGTLAGTEYTAMGDVVNTASRLQSAAPPGGILVGHTTYALASQTIRFEPAGELDARGREQSVKAWLAVEATAPPGSRSRRGRNGPLVGREPETGHRSRPRSISSASPIAACCWRSPARTASASRDSPTS